MGGWPDPPLHCSSSTPRTELRSGHMEASAAPVMAFQGTFPKKGTEKHRDDLLPALKDWGTCQRGHHGETRAERTNRGKHGRDAAVTCGQKRGVIPRVAKSGNREQSRDGIGEQSLEHHRRSCGDEGREPDIRSGLPS